MATNILTQDRLQQLFTYDATTGHLINKQTSKRAGYRHHSGYRNICVDDRTYIEHRVIWLLCHGEWPSKDIDHINRIRDDNRLSNLRLATRAENCQNQPIRRTNGSGLTGVYYHKVSKKWAAVINVNKKQQHLGTYDTFEQARDVRLAAEQQHYTFATT